MGVKGGVKNLHLILSPVVITMLGRQSLSEICLFVSGYFPNEVGGARLNSAYSNPG